MCLAQGLSAVTKEKDGIDRGLPPPGSLKGWQTDLPLVGLLKRPSYSELARHGPGNKQPEYSSSEMLAHCLSLGLTVGDGPKCSLPHSAHPKFTDVTMLNAI